MSPLTGVYLVVSVNKTCWDDSIITRSTAGASPLVNQVPKRGKLVSYCKSSMWGAYGSVPLSLSGVLHGLEHFLMEASAETKSTSTDSSGRAPGAPHLGAKHKASHTDIALVTWWEVVDTWVDTGDGWQWRRTWESVRIRSDGWLHSSYCQEHFGWVAWQVV